MILYSKNLDPNFSKYGIEIPIVDDRPSRVYEYLKDKFGEEFFFTGLNINSLTKNELLLAHNREFVENLYSDNKEQEVVKAFHLINENGEYNRFDPSKAEHSLAQLVSGILQQANGTYYTSKRALTAGFTFFLGGGMHHAMSFGGRGFCLVNDVVIAIRKLQNEKLIKKAWIIDLDAHKGDGAAEICQNDDSIRTFSIHMAHGWPLDDLSLTNPSLLPNDLDVPVEKDQERNYNRMLESGLNKFHEMFFAEGVDLAIVVDGADPYERDLLPSSSLLQLTKEEMLIRDQLVYNFLTQNKIPMCGVIAGGYGPHVWEIYAQFLEWVIQKRS